MDAQRGLAPKLLHSSHPFVHVVRLAPPCAFACACLHTWRAAQARAVNSSWWYMVAVRLLILFHCLLIIPEDQSQHESWTPVVELMYARRALPARARVDPPVCSILLVYVVDVGVRMAAEGFKRHLRSSNHNVAFILAVAALFVDVVRARSRAAAGLAWRRTARAAQATGGGRCGLQHVVAARVAALSSRVSHHCLARVSARGVCRDVFVRTPAHACGAHRSFVSTLVHVLPRVAHVLLMALVLLWCARRASAHARCCCLCLHGCVAVCSLYSVIGVAFFHGVYPDCYGLQHFDLFPNAFLSLVVGRPFLSCSVFLLSRAFWHLCSLTCVCCDSYLSRANKLTTTLQVLLTTENFPFIIMPALQHSPVRAAVFFVSYVVLGVWIYWSLLLAVMVDSYKICLTQEVLSSFSCSVCVCVCHCRHICLCAYAPNSSCVHNSWPNGACEHSRACCSPSRCCTRRMRRWTMPPSSSCSSTSGRTRRRARRRCALVRAQ